MRRKTLCIQCNTCGSILFRYIKIGKGHLIRCWKNRMIDNTLIQEKNEYYCPCGKLIGTDEKVWIKLKKQQISIN
jgi:hypothetical protein